MPGKYAVAQRLGRDEPACDGARARAQLRHAPRELAELHRGRRARLTRHQLLELHVERVRRPLYRDGLGDQVRHTNFSRGNFGWMQAANTQTVTASGNYTLSPIEGTAPASLRCRVQRTSSTYLTLELRQPSGTFDDFPGTSLMAAGVIVRITPGYTTRSQSQLVDTNPASTSYADAPLRRADAHRPADRRLGHDAGVAPAGATVRVTFEGVPPPPSDATAPSQPGNLHAAALDTSRVSLSWAASTDNVGVTGYRILRNSAPVTTVTGTGWTDTGLAPSTTYGYQVVALDAAVNASTPASASATTHLRLPRTRRRRAPRRTCQSPLAGARRSCSRGPLARTTWRRRLPRAARRDAGRPDAGDHVHGHPRRQEQLTATYVVVAYDLAGNVSAASIPASVP